MNMKKNQKKETEAIPAEMMLLIASVILTNVIKQVLNLTGSLVKNIGIYLAIFLPIYLISLLILRLVRGRKKDEE